MNLPLPALPNTQALNSPTFKKPPIDGSLTIPEIYDWHLENTPNHPIFAYPDGPDSIRTILWPEAVRAVHEAGRIVCARLDVDENHKITDTPIVAILSLADTIPYFTVIAGAMRAGFGVFPISPRNSPAAVAHLLSKMKAAHFLVGAEQALKDLASASLDLMKGDKPATSPMLAFEDLYFNDPSSFKPLPPRRFALDAPALVLHSSGSTAFPKPIVWNHYRFMQLSSVPYFGERDLTGQRLGCQALPMFHGMGCFQIGWTALSGLIVTTFKPQSPAKAMTPEHVFEGAMDAKSDIIFCVPSFIEEWAKNPEHVAKLQKIEGVLYGGGPLNKEVGETLTAKGISIFNLYGCTEVGIASPIIPQVGDFQYIRMSSQMKCVMEPDGQGHAELVVYPHELHAPAVVNSKRGDFDVYATSDLFIEHPEKPGYWAVYGRSDDQIMHNTGEKTNPGPLENILKQDPYVFNSVMFGRGRFNAGVLVEPMPSERFDPTDTVKLEQYRNMIWPTVERLNKYAPQHSRLFKEMIIVTSPSKPFTYTAKNTVRRHAVLAEYADEIEALYKAFDETTQSDISPPKAWTDDESLKFVRTVVAKVMKKELDDDADVFQHGCDSLQATWIRNSLLHALKETTEANTRVIPGNIVYEYPSISALAKFATETASSQAADVSVDAKVTEMLALADKYGHNFLIHTPSAPAPEQDVLLVTGTTGGLGTALLAEIAASDKIARVYAVNRPDRAGVSLKERQEASLEQQGLDPAIASSSKVVLVETDVSEPNLGVPAELFEEIRSSVTHIIHNAWHVNFNVPLKSFEPQVRGVRNFIDLALSSPHPSPARLLFTSSIGVLRQRDTTGPAPEAPVEPAVAIGNGYSESKWVSEKVLQLAAEQTPLKATSIRVGQISGAVGSGYWKVTEWFPSLVKSSIHLGNVPGGEQPVSWLPLDVSAKVVVEMRNSPSPIVHLAHPRPVPLSNILKPISDAFGIPVIPYAEWVAALEHSVEASSSAPGVESALRANPASKLIDFFRGGLIQDDPDAPTREAMGLPFLQLDEAKRSSETLRDANLKQLSAVDVERWLSYWRSKGFIAN